MRTTALAFALTAAVALAGCQFPADPDGTLERARGDVLRVGVSEHEPWVLLEKPEPGGVEPELMRRFARSIDARVDWVEGSEAELVERMEKGEIDVSVAGFLKQTPWKKMAAVTRPYVQVGKDKHVVLARLGENALLVELEEFLLARERLALELFAREGGP